MMHHKRPRIAPLRAVVVSRLVAAHKTGPNASARQRGAFELYDQDDTINTPTTTTTPRTLIVRCAPHTEPSDAKA